MRQPCNLQTNIRKPCHSELPPKLCGAHGNGLPDVPQPEPAAPVVASPQKHRGETLRFEGRSKLVILPPPPPPSDAEIRKVAEDAIAMFLKRWQSGK